MFGPVRTVGRTFRIYALELRFDRHELSGALGDTGILLPLAAALIVINGLNPTVVFAGAGLLYVAAAFAYRLPMPVQPLKAFSAIAIASSLGGPVIAAGALLMGVATIGLSLTGGVRLLARFIPFAVVKGIQLSLGITLLLSAWKLATARDALFGLVAVAGSSVPVSLVVGLVAFAAILVLLRWPFVPASLTVLLAGVGLALFLGATAPATAVGPMPVQPVAFGWNELLAAFALLVVPQLPLSIGNALISTSDVARAYFGERAERVTPSRLALSMGIANVIVGPLGGMPMCHGAGGLTAHVRFGARTAAAAILIGGIYLVIGFVFARQAHAIATLLIPSGVLAALLAYVGFEHLQLVRAVRGTRDWASALVVGTVAPLSNLAVGMLLGLLVWHLWHAIESRRLDSATR